MKSEREREFPFFIVVQMGFSLNDENDHCWGENLKMLAAFKVLDHQKAFKCLIKLGSNRQFSYQEIRDDRIDIRNYLLSSLK